MKTKMIATFIFLLCLPFTSNSQARDYRLDTGWTHHAEKYSEIWVPAGTLSYFLSVACDRDQYGFNSAEAGIWCQDGNAYIYCTSYYQWWGNTISGSIVLNSDQTIGVSANVSCYEGIGAASIVLQW